MYGLTGYTQVDHRAVVYGLNKSSQKNTANIWQERGRKKQKNKKNHRAWNFALLELGVPTFIVLLVVGKR